MNSGYRGCPEFAGRQISIIVNCFVSPSASGTPHGSQFGKRTTRSVKSKKFPYGVELKFEVELKLDFTCQSQVESAPPECRHRRQVEFALPERRRRRRLVESACRQVESLPEREIEPVRQFCRLWGSTSSRTIIIIICLENHLLRIVISSLDNNCC